MVVGRGCALRKLALGGNEVGKRGSAALASAVQVPSARGLVVVVEGPSHQRPRPSGPGS